MKVKYVSPILWETDPPLPWSITITRRQQKTPVQAAVPFLQVLVVNSTMQQMERSGVSACVWANVVAACLVSCLSNCDSSWGSSLNSTYPTVMDCDYVFIGLFSGYRFPSLRESEQVRQLLEGGMEEVWRDGGREAPASGAPGAGGLRVLGHQAGGQEAHQGLGSLRLQARPSNHWQSWGAENKAKRSGQKSPPRHRLSCAELTASRKAPVLSGAKLGSRQLPAEKIKTYT